MGQKLYQRTEDGGIAFHSERRAGEVRIPNYVYDLWMPLVGATAIGVYAVYCRLERQTVVKGVSMRRIARACRVGLNTLSEINDALQSCGFIRIGPPPTGQERLMHWTRQITVCDPPESVSTEQIELYGLKATKNVNGYEPLSTWLVADTEASEEPSLHPTGCSGEPNEVPDAHPTGCPKIESLGLNPLNFACASAENLQTPPSSPQSESTGTSTIQDLPLQGGIIEPPDLDESGPRGENTSAPAPVEVIPSEFQDLFPDDGSTHIDDRRRKPRTAEGNAVETMRALAGSVRHAQAWTLKAAGFRSMQDRLVRCNDRQRVIAIGQALDDVGLEPTWSSKSSTARWIDEIEGLLEVAHGNEGLVVRAIGDAVRENAQRGYPLTYKGPHSFEGAVKKELMKRATTDSNSAAPISRRITVDEW